MIIIDIPDDEGNAKKEIVFTKNSATRSDDNDEDGDN